MVETGSQLRGKNAAYRIRLLALTATATAALIASSAACAQDAPAAEAGPVTELAAADDQTAVSETQADPTQEITVTGSRIVRDGYSAPTPVSVISAEEIQREAPANITDFVNTLPAVRGSGTAATSNGSLSNGAAGINTVNLRNLGAARTLVLFDGQRSVASATTGVVDVNTFPQALIERVEVVTGGASSAYGSDAVSGVVNFILDKDFTGFKMDYEFGITTYGDGQNHKVSATGGQSFADGRGHILLSGEYFSQTGIHSIDRDWNEAGFFQIDNPAYSAAACTDSSAATLCVPARLIQGGIGTGQFTPGGLISTGAFRGVYFGNVDPATGRATLNQLGFGATNGQWMVGGDYDITSDGHRSSATLLPAEKRGSLFGRLSYDFADAFKVFGQVSYSYYRARAIISRRRPPA